MRGVLLLEASLLLLEGGVLRADDLVGTRAGVVSPEATTSIVNTVMRAMGPICVMTMAPMLSKTVHA